MNKLLYFLLGLAVGSVPTYFYMKKKVDVLLDEINDIKDYNDISNQYVSETDEDEEVNPPLDDIRDKLNRNYEKTTNYAEMYHKRRESDEELESEHPVDSDEDEEEWEDDDILTDDQEAALEATKDHQKNKDKPPKIISEEAVADLPTYIDNAILYYYFDDGSLVNEEEEELVAEDFIGNALTKYGFDTNNEDKIFVMNYALDTCYEVVKIMGAWKDTRM